MNLKASDRLTDLLTEWFIELHFVAKNQYLGFWLNIRLGKLIFLESGKKNQTTLK